MTTIHKYTLVPGVQSVAAPVGARPLHVAVQRGVICLWAEVDPAAPDGWLPVEVVGTGWMRDQSDAPHVGTAITDDGNYVWHVYGSPAVPA